jgi:hypothetical protein
MACKYMLRTAGLLALAGLLVASLCGCQADSEQIREARERIADLSPADLLLWKDVAETQRRVEHFVEMHELPSWWWFDTEQQRANEASLGRLHSELRARLRIAEETGVSEADWKLATGKDSLSQVRSDIYRHLNRQERLALYRELAMYWILGATALALTIYGFISYRRRRREREEQLRRQSDEIEAWLAEQRRNLDALDTFYGSQNSAGGRAGPT